MGRDRGVSKPRSLTRRAIRLAVRAGVVIILCIAVFKAVLFNVCRHVPMPDRITIYSIDGRGAPSDLPRQPVAYTGEQFHGYPVVGKVEISDRSDRRTIRSVLNSGLATFTLPAKCFWPRHAVRLVRGDEVIDLLICFECHQVEVIDGVSDDRGTELMGSGPRRVLNRYLTDAGAELVPEDR